MIRLELAVLGPMPPALAAAGRPATLCLPDPGTGTPLREELLAEVVTPTTLLLLDLAELGAFLGDRAVVPEMVEEKLEEDDSDSSSLVKVPCLTITPWWASPPPVAVVAQDLGLLRLLPPAPRADGGAEEEAEW